MVGKASGKLISYCQERARGKEFSLAEVRAQLLNRVWHSWVGKLGISGQDAVPLRLERVVRALIREGVDKQRIRYRNDRFRIRLENGEYVLFKTQDQAVHAWLPGIRCAGVDVRVSGAAFARFLLDFDAAVPGILRPAEAVVAAISRNAIEYRKDCLIASIRDTVKRNKPHRIITTY